MDSKTCVLCEKDIEIISGHFLGAKYQGKDICTDCLGEIYSGARDVLRTYVAEIRYGDRHAKPAVTE